VTAIFLCCGSSGTHGEDARGGYRMIQSQSAEVSKLDTNTVWSRGTFCSIIRQEFN